MEPTDDKKVELLYSHYTETFALTQSQGKTRDWLFVAILILLGLMSFQIALPTTSGATIADFVKQQLNVQTELSISFLGSVVWAALLFTAVRYFQIGVGLERSYRYIHALEEDLNAYYPGGTAFTREGKFYLNEYPWFSWAVARGYRMIFPVALALAATLKIYSEFRLANLNALALIIDAAIYTMLLASSTLYFLHINLGK